MRHGKATVSCLIFGKAGTTTKEIDLNYAKYLLKEGSVIEKRELLSCMKSKLVIKEKQIALEGVSSIYNPAALELLDRNKIIF